LIVLGVSYYFLRFGVFRFAARYVPFIQKLDWAAMAVVLLLVMAKLFDVYLIGRLDSPVSRYTLRRIAKLVLALLTIFVTISIVISNWYTTLLSVGLFSLILGLAVSTPMTSFLGWIYFLVRAPYRVGARI